ncbi:MAG TPA: glycerophosphodiester phosphodiesterase family protein [Bacteriovoracaceae bacterium]|nr:glycerophosphodiester phosphodiesterase family protein [Bacteriovoracaceae bacterium]
MKSLIVLFLISFVGPIHAFDWQGHRGARGLYPENTLGAMEVALKYPIKTLEFDVVVTKDNKVILSHEPWMNEVICLDPLGKKIKGKEFNIYQMSYSEVAKFDCGSLAHPQFLQQKKVKVAKPTLDEVLVHTKDKNKNIFYNIEIKSTVENEKLGFQPEYKVFSDLVIKDIKKHLPESRFSIQSFDWRVLKYIHQKYPEVRLVALKYGKFEVDKVLSDLGFTPSIFSPYFKDLTKKKVLDFQKKGIKVIPWTVNELKDLKAIKGMGVDGIITDYPDRIKK